MLSPFLFSSRVRHPVVHPGGVLRNGFTLMELLVSVAILLIITVTVMVDIGRARYREELNGAALSLLGAMRDLQARAFAASGVTTCDGGGVKFVCESSATGCTNSCSTQVAPYALGAVVTGGAGSMQMFAEVESTFNNRRELGLGGGVGGDEHEQLKLLQLPSSVTISSPIIGTVNGTPTSQSGGVYVTFERQNGAMRINPCGTPALAPACGTPEWSTMRISLLHSRLGNTITRRVHLNSVTGRIYLE